MKIKLGHLFFASLISLSVVFSAISNTSAALRIGTVKKYRTTSASGFSKYKKKTTRSVRKASTRNVRKPRTTTASMVSTYKKRPTRKVRKYRTTPVSGSETRKGREATEANSDSYNDESTTSASGFDHSTEGNGSGLTVTEGVDSRLFQSLDVNLVNTLSAEELMSEQMIVSVNFDVLKQDNEYAANLMFDLFGQSLQVDKKRVTQRNPSAYAWFGKVSDNPLSKVILTVGDNIMFGRIEYLDSVYKIEPIEDGTFHRIIKLDPTKMVPFGDDGLIPPQVNQPQDVVLPPNVQNDNVNGLVNIDIMILYTNGMAAAYPGNQITTRINHLVDLANTAYTDSQIKMRLNVVGTIQVSYTDGGSLNTAIDDLRCGTGVFANVANLRNQRYADVVVLLRRYVSSNNNVCGLGWVMQDVSLDFAEWAFSVVQDGTICSDYTLAHEVGHNMGNAHDLDHANADGAYNYSYGFDISGLFGTIMSYDGPRIGYFSNPDNTVEWIPMGIYDSANNARSMQNTMRTVASFRRRPLPPPRDIRWNVNHMPLPMLEVDIYDIRQHIPGPEFPDINKLSRITKINVPNTQYLGTVINSKVSSNVSSSVQAQLKGTSVNAASTLNSGVITDSQSFKQTIINTTGGVALTNLTDKVISINTTGGGVLTSVTNAVSLGTNLILRR